MNEDQPNPNPWLRSLMVWGGIFLALVLVVSMMSPREAATGPAIAYSDFRAKVAEGSVSEVQIAADKVTGKFKNGDTFWKIARANGTTPDAVMKANRITDPRKLRPGMQLIVP